MSSVDAGRLFCLERCSCFGLSRLLCTGNACNEVRCVKVFIMLL